MIDAVGSPSGKSHAAGGPPSVALIGTYVPRRCGIATFTHDLANGLRASADGARVQVIAVNDGPKNYRYPPDVVFEIQQNNLRDYRVAAEYLNTNRIDAVNLQHEYGIFGGQDGDHILNLVGRLRMPIVTTLHTVRKNPSESQRRVIRDIAEASERVIVMNGIAKSFLLDVYDVPGDKAVILPHGVPDLAFVDPAFYKEQFGVDGSNVILTFGLLSPNKGIEHMIRALPRVLAEHPNTVYLVLGATHPQVRERHGEEYRLSLEQLARTLSVDEHVMFHDRYVDPSELGEFLGAADIYVTPYLSEEQVVSGTLAYAMSAGKAIVSTPYWHAREVLADERGRLVPFGDDGALARSVIDLLSDARTRHAMRRRAYLHARGSVWQNVGRRCLTIFDEVRSERSRRPRMFRSAKGREEAVVLPEINLTHLRRLTDDVGILQHAAYHIPDRRYGYCTDDNARALIVTLRVRPYVAESEEMNRLSERYLAFLQYAFDPERATFRNFLGYDRQWTEAVGSPDSIGRAVWALGLAAARADDSRLRALAAGTLRVVAGRLVDLVDLRAMSFALLGLGPYLEAYGGDSVARRARDVLADRMRAAFERTAANDWPWPETTLTYENARLPQAMLDVGRRTASPELVNLALRSLRWLSDVQEHGGRFSPVGNQGWFERGGSKSRFDQQPIEASGMVAACMAAYRLTTETLWLQRALMAFEWFLGRNDVGQSLYDESTGGCRDGLHPTGVSENQGAESALAWLDALVSIHVYQAAGDAGWAQRALATTEDAHVYAARPESR